MDQVEDFSNAKLPINGCSLSTVLKVMKTSRLKYIFTVLRITLQIAVALPINSMAPKNTFFKLTIVKNRLHSTTSGDRLEHLMILYYIYTIRSKKKNF